MHSVARSSSGAAGRHVQPTGGRRVPHRERAAASVGGDVASVRYQTPAMVPTMPKKNGTANVAAPM